MLQQRRRPQSHPWSAVILHPMLVSLHRPTQGLGRVPTKCWGWREDFASPTDLPLKEATEWHKVVLTCSKWHQASEGYATSKACHYRQIDVFYWTLSIMAKTLAAKQFAFDKVVSVSPPGPEWLNLLLHLHWASLRWIIHMVFVVLSMYLVLVAQSKPSVLQFRILPLNLLKNVTSNLRDSHTILTHCCCS